MAFELKKSKTDVFVAERASLTLEVGMFGGMLS
jgi:hypothetical protein